MISKPTMLAPMLLAASLFGAACGDDEGVTPVCPNAADCITQPGKPPPPDASAADADEGSEEDAGEGDET